jgi:hypothetical protein
MCPVCFSVTDTVRLNRLQWSEYVQRMGGDRIPKRVLYMIWKQQDRKVDQEIDGKMK